MNNHQRPDCLELLKGLDDWQRGFLDAVFAAQGILVPTHDHGSAALKRMTSYVIRMNGGELPADGRITCARRDPR